MHLDPALRAWIENTGKIVGATPLTGGYSNDNTLLTMAGGDRYVLRRYLRRNSCALESALAGRLTGIVPVADVVAADPDGARAGEPVLLSRFVPGRPLNEVLAAEPGAAAELGRAVGDTLAAIGSVTYPVPGFLTGGDPPDGAEPIGGLDLFVRRCLAEGNAAGHLSDHEQRDLVRYAAEVTGELDALAGSRQLVHGDFNPKNLLAERYAGGWRVAAVLDWEYAFSSSPLFDVGNMLRDRRPDGFTGAFLAAFRSGGGDLPVNWRRLTQGLDLYSLADLLTRPVEHRYFGRAVERIRVVLSGR